MKCTFCGAELEEGTFFCTSCGNRIDNGSTASPIPEPQEFKDEEYSDDNMTTAFEAEDESEPSVSEDEDSISISLDEIVEEDEPSDNTDEELSQDISLGEEADDTAAEPSSESYYAPEEASEEYYDKGAQETFPSDSSSYSEEDNYETQIIDSVEDQNSAEVQDEVLPASVQDADELPVQVPAAVSPVPSGSSAKLSFAIVMLSAALFAICGFLFIDKLVSLTPSDSRASTIRIVSQSQDITVKPGTATEFYVDAEGTNLTYQWYVKKSGEQLWHLWKSHDSFKTNSKANESWDGMQVYCMIVDNNRTSAASEIITISIEK